MPHPEPEQAGLALELPSFGTIEPERVLAQDELFTVVRDKHPVAPGHTLIIPRRPVERFRELTATEKARLVEWVDWAQAHLQVTLVPAPDGFNLGVNDGKAAGQTMPQFHFHVIPRHAGDVPDPRGGIRWVIPNKARYWDRPIEPPMDAAETDAIERCSRCLDDPQLHDLIEASCLPVPACGDAHSSRVKVATIGLNPSWTEFFSNRTQLRPATQRLSHLQDFRAASREFLTPEDLGKAACKRAEYFAADIRIAHDWFSNLTALLDACGRGWSYQNGQAVHLDLVARTTKASWGRIQQEDAQRMIRNCQSHFRQTLSMLPADVLLLADGRSAADTLVGDSRSWQHLKDYSETDGTVKPLLVRSGTLRTPAGEWRYCAWNMTVKHLPAEPLANLKQWLACSVRVGDPSAGAEDGASSE